MTPRNGMTMSSLPMSAVEGTASSSPPVTEGGIGGGAGDEKTSIVARRVSASLPSLERCGERLRAGQLVSFPTETVYGLGCHALDPAAVRRVFDAKERPLSDPLIVHVTRCEDALGLWDASSDDDDGADFDGSAIPTDERRRRRRHQQRQRRDLEKRALSALTSSFFPGPLTLVARARPSVPPILMAGTGYVACRSPSHAVARALIDAAGVPIAAPSANKFGHVSPTRPDHVLDDLGMEDVWVVDPDLGAEGVVAGARARGDDVCGVGVESTVAKIEMHDGVADAAESSPSSSSGGDDGDATAALGSVTILRHGAVSSRQIGEALKKAGLSRYFAVSDSIGFTSEGAHNVAPGQTVRHYSPNVPCFMICRSRQQDQPSGGGGQGEGEEEEAADVSAGEVEVLSRSVVVDYGGRLARYRKHALAYDDLSPGGDPTSAAARLFETLRWSETVEGAMRVFVPEIVLGVSGGDDDGEGAGKGHSLPEDRGALVLAVKDKLTRAASAVVVSEFL